MTKNFKGFVITRPLFDIESRIEFDMKVLIGEFANTIVATIVETSPKKFSEGLVNVKFKRPDGSTAIEEREIKELKVLALSNVGGENQSFRKGVESLYPIAIADSQWEELVERGRYDTPEIVEYGIIYKLINPYERDIKKHKHTPIAKLAREKPSNWDAIFNKIESIIGKPEENDTALSYNKKVKEAFEKYYFKPKYKQ